MNPLTVSAELEGHRVGDRARGCRVWEAMQAVCRKMRTLSMEREEEAHTPESDRDRECGSDHFPVPARPSALPVTPGRLHNTAAPTCN